MGSMMTEDYFSMPLVCVPERNTNKLNNHVRR